MDHLSRRYDEPRFLIVGDLNSYAREDPIVTLREAGFVDLIATHLPASQRYSYVFRGESGRLDHALATPALAADVAAVYVWHINADEPPFLGYDRPDNAAGLFAPDPFRASDHDPILVDLQH
ncbi:endonuclease/exonuclease/phosphatase family protein [Alkalilimnicola ehrlichii]|uniref:endonuclease/exonuclease/phosphatase family protein n=1 Tax=Alkalilimnicola ehrlichii TaxID=351052 RepID=UPI0021629DAF|nr:endonuclease/exonuclease/phosphatase family protein [Alkalilimnicola ehrlichii]